jgi:hypothetical protein
MAATFQMGVMSVDHSLVARVFTLARCLAYSPVNFIATLFYNKP